MSALSNNNSVLLIVEDDIDDYLLLSEVITDEMGKVKINWVKDGEDCLDYLNHNDKYSSEVDSPTPDLIFLDLNLPIIGGMEVLDAMHGADELKKIPVIVFSTSNDRNDIINSYNKGANSYISKPNDYESYKDIAKMIHNYWFNYVKLPA
ncbi:MAG: two-component system response regulator [Bacteroidetes bacterium]|nr:response regulator [Bacteroidia bacterium]PCH65103.1 MAG: two-component system response regulator [Bacteroidota bacterium]